MNQNVRMMSVLQEIADIFSNIQSKIQNSTQIVRSHKIKINLTGYTANKAIGKILLILKQILIKLNENDALSSL